MVSIVILSYRNPPLLRLCLRSLATALKGELSYEIIVVDNATTAETRSVVEDEFKSIFPSIRLIPIKENSGYTHGVNEGIKAAQGEYILSLNQDIVVLPGAIEKMQEYLAQNPEIGLLGPELLNFNGTHQDSYFKFYKPSTVLYRRMGFLPFAQKSVNEFLMRESDPRQIQKPDWISGAAFMTTRKALDAIGLLDEDFFHYFSDVDWSRRFWENGLQVVYYPGAQIYHYLGRSSKGKMLFFDIFFNPTTRWHIKDALHYFKKYGFLTNSSHARTQ